MAIGRGWRGPSPCSDPGADLGPDLCADLGPDLGPDLDADQGADPGADCFVVLAYRGLQHQLHGSLRRDAGVKP